MKEDKLANNKLTKQWSNALRVGWFLAYRQVKGSNKATTFLIVFIMMLTFLNLVVVSGILIGLIEGGNKANREQYTGDLMVSTLPGEQAIEHTNEIESTIARMKDIESFSVRFLAPVEIEANYKTRRDFSTLRDTAGT